MVENSSMAERTEIEALVSLLDDPDMDVQSGVRTRFDELGEDAVPVLDELRAYSADIQQQSLIEDVIHQLTYKTLEQEFLNYLEDGVESLRDLEEGMFLVARFGNPTLRTELYRRKLDQMAQIIRDDIRLADDPIEQMRILLQYLFKEETFRGDQKQYFSPENSYLNQVMDRKKGIPLTLGLILLFISDRLGLNFSGVNMPMHFLVRFDGDRTPYFIDPFHDGNIIRIEQCRLFLKQNGIEPQAHHFEAAQPIEILARCIRNLLNGYEKQGHAERFNQMERWHHYIEMIYLKPQ